MLSAFANCLKIPELRQRIFFTFALIVVARVGAHIPLPGIDPGPLKQFFKDQTADAGAAGSLVGLYNMFTGGALLKGAICSLGIMPYVSASIIFQLMVAVVPSLARLQQEGDVGRQKISQYTRYATVLICLVQGALLIGTLLKPETLFSGFDPQKYGAIVITQSTTWFIVTSTIFLTAGTLLMMWLGEQITQRGIGNGVSILITIGILADIPGAAYQTYRMFVAPIGVQRLGPLEGVLMALLFIGVTMFIIAITQAQRKIPVQHAKRMVGQKVYGGQTSFLPLKINYSGVMPVIFASAILLFPQMILSWVGGNFGLHKLSEIANNLIRGHWIYYGGMTMLILFFSYFWVSVMFKPIQIADELKRYGGYIPGVRPGEPTASFLDFIMTRLTLAGAIALTAIAVLPDILLYQREIPQRIAYFFGGTGMLITVGVVLDTMKQLETFLLQRHYDGFLRKGRLRSRSTQLPTIADTTEIKNLQPLLITCGSLLVVGLVAWVVREFVLKS